MVYNCSQTLNYCSNRLLQLLYGLSLISTALLVTQVYEIIWHKTERTISAGIMIALLLMICGGIFFVKKLMHRRIIAISETVNAIISTGDLSRRIPIEAKWEDLSSLSNMLNKMLSEIERLVNDARSVADNVSHDLRTPLTRLRNHIEEMRVSVTDNASIEDQQERYRQLTVECDALLATFQALLRISNLESGHKYSEFSTLNLTHLLRDVVEFYEPLAAEKNISFHYEIADNAAFIGDKDLLFQAFANVVDNAIKYTPEQGEIHLSLRADKNHAVFELRDSGPGIIDTDKQRVFRRFFRVDEARSEPGSGLGLSLVAAIIALHKGTIQLSDNQPQGLVVTMTF